MVEQLTPTQQRHLVQLSTTMNRFRQKEVLSDFLIECDGQQFPANKIVLAACSPFFAEMFEEIALDEKCEQLQRIPGEIMKILLEFMYTGNISIDIADASKLTTLVTFANDLQLSILVEYCLEFLLQSLTFTNILQFRKLVDKMNNDELKKEMMKLVAQNIFKASNADDILGDLPVDWLVEILSREDVRLESPDKIFRTVLAWVTLDTTQRIAELKQLLPFIDKKGLSDDVLHDLSSDRREPGRCLFEMKEMDVFHNCPELMMFVYDVMSSRYRALSSTRGSTSSLYSETSESNDIVKDENAELTKDGSAVIQGKNEEQLPTIKEETLVATKNPVKPPILNNSVSDKEVKRNCDVSVSQTLPMSSDAAPLTQKIIPISTSPSVKDTSSSSTPDPRNSMNRVNGPDIRRALEQTPLLLTPYKTSSQCSALRNPAPSEVVNTANQDSGGAKPKQIVAKPQRTVANLDLLTVGKKQVKSEPSAPNATTRRHVNAVEFQPSNSRGGTPERKRYVDNKYEAFRIHGDRNRNPNDLVSCCDEVIRNHEANRNYVPNHHSDRLDRTSHATAYPRKPFRIPESPSQETVLHHELNRTHESKSSDTPLVSTSTDQSGNENSSTSKNRVPVSIKTSRQKESSKDVFFVMENNNEWCVETFSTETDDWADPKPMPSPIYHRSAVVAVGHVIYVIGGTTDKRSVVKTVFMYNTRTNEWRTIGDTQVARYAAGGAQLGSYVYVVGGVSDVNTPLNHVERYSPLTNMWSSAAPLTACREQPSVASVDDRLYVIGGYVILPQQWQMRTIETKSTATGEIYDPSANQWTEIDTPLAIGREVVDKTFCTTALNDRLFSIRVRSRNLDSPCANPVLFEYSLKAKHWFRYTISDLELMNVAHICSMNNDQLCLVSGKGSVYIFQSINGMPDLQKCCEEEKTGLVYAAMPGVSK